MYLGSQPTERKYIASRRQGGGNERMCPLVKGSRDNPEGYTVSRPNLRANTSVLAQTSLAKRPCAREAGGLLTPRVTPSFRFLWRQLARRLHPILLRGSNRGRDRLGMGPRRH